MDPAPVAELIPPTRVLRQLSVQAVMNVLLREGGASRAGLARQTGLSKQTMSEVMRLLSERGWVRESGKITGGVGRTAVRYEVDAEAGFVLGVDLGASTIRASIANIAGAIVREGEVASDPRGGAHLVDQIGTLKRTLLAEANVPVARLLQATVALPGVVDPATGRLSLAPNLDDMGHMNVVSSIAQVLDCKVTFENDVNAGAIGEFWETPQSQDEHFAFVSIGTGVGLGIIVEGKLLRGAAQAAGEVGYLPLGADPFSPLNVERGALESVLGAAGIAQRYHLAGGAPGGDGHRRRRSGQGGHRRQYRWAAGTGRPHPQGAAQLHPPACRRAMWPPRRPGDRGGRCRNRPWRAAKLPFRDERTP